MLGQLDFSDGLEIDVRLRRGRTLDRRRLGLCHYGLGDGWRGNARRSARLLRRDRRHRLFWLDGTDQPIALRLAAHSIGLGLLDGRRVALHANPELNAEIESLFVGEA